MRRVLAIFLVASSLSAISLGEVVHSQPAAPTRTTPDASALCSAVSDDRKIKDLHDILSCISPYAEAPPQTINYWIATDELIRFIDRIDRVDYCLGQRLHPREERLEWANRIRRINAAVNTALSTPKDADYWILDSFHPYPILLQYINRTISPADKSRSMTESDVKIDQITTILADYDRYGTESKLLELTEDVLNSGNELFNWGMDAFLTSARGYAIYQFVRNCVTGRDVSPSVVRAYAARTAAESEQYFYAQFERLNTLSPPRPILHRWEDEKVLIEGGPGAGGGFPKEIYLGTNIPPMAVCADDKLFQNWYGTLKYNNSIWAEYPAPPGSGFSIDGDGVSTECEDRINFKNRGAISTLIAARLEALGPTSDLTNEIARNRLQLIVEAINGQISRLTFEKLSEECLVDSSKDCPRVPGGAISGEGLIRQIRSERPVIMSEFRALGAMAQAIKAILARSPHHEIRP